MTLQKPDPSDPLDGQNRVRKIRHILGYCQYSGEEECQHLTTGYQEEEIEIATLKALIHKETQAARLEELKWANTRSPAGKLSDIDYKDRIAELKATLGGTDA